MHLTGSHVWAQGVGCVGCEGKWRCTAELATHGISYLFLKIPSARANADKQVRRHVFLSVPFFFPSSLHIYSKLPPRRPPFIKFSHKISLKIKLTSEVYITVSKGISLHHNTCPLLRYNELGYQPKGKSSGREITPLIAQVMDELWRVTKRLYF